MPRWTSRENGYLWNHGGHVPVAHLAKRLGRSESAIRKQLQRLKIQRRRGAHSSVASLSEHLGFSRSVITRVGKEHRQKWLANNRPDNRVRYSITEEQAEEIEETLKVKPWSRNHERCFACGTSGEEDHQQHHARGLCRRCYRNGYSPETIEARRDS